MLSLVNAKMGNPKLKFLKLATAGVVVAMGVVAVPAGAAPILTLSEPGFTPMSGTVSGNNVTFSGNYGDFATNFIIGVSNSNTATTSGQISITDLSIVNTSAATTGSKVLTITVSDNGFTLPGVVGQRLQLVGGLGGGLSGAVAGDKISFIATATPSTGAAATTGTQTFTATTLTSTNTSFNIPAASATFTQSGSYTIADQIIVSLTAPNASANLAGLTTVGIAPVPEPVGLSIAAVAAMGLLRRRPRMA